MPMPYILIKFGLQTLHRISHDNDDAVCIRLERYLLTYWMLNMPECVLMQLYVHYKSREIGTMQIWDKSYAYFEDYCQYL